GFKQNIFILPNGVDTEIYSPCPHQKRIPIREALSLPPNTVLFVFSGRLELVKGIDILIQAWEGFIQSSHQNATLVILGTGSREKSLGEGINNCLFRGPVENVRDYLQAADVFVMPSRYEGTSLAVLEAMACQLPVLLTRVGGNPELVDHLKNGILIPPEKPECLTAWMDFLSDNISLRERLGAKARETVSQRFSFDQIIHDYEEICYSVLTEKNHLEKFIN
ncbi:MAG: glycosyltransferase family 4 protein, partial [Desulfitobacteriaceae bacterium]|nr:glycosyltransferase family 4 protein [Desulfitobacteriaceae bacterium]